MLFFQGQMPPRSYERSLQLLLLRQQGMKCCSVRVGTERKGRCLCGGSAFYFSCCTDLDFGTEKRNPGAAVCVYMYTYFSSAPSTCVEEEMKSNLSDLFSGTIGYFSSFPRFAAAFYLEILLSCVYPSSSAGVAETEERMLGCSAGGTCRSAAKCSQKKALCRYKLSFAYMENFKANRIMRSCQVQSLRH